MPDFDITDPATGRTLTVTGDTPPTQEDAAFLFAHPAAQPADAAPPPVTARAVAHAAARGVPVVGGLLNKANAAINASLDPAVSAVFGTAPMPGNNWSERYNNQLERFNSADAQFDQAHPYVSDAAQLAGGIAGAAAVPLPGVPATASVPVKMLAGGATGAAVSGADALVRNGGDLNAAAAPAVAGAVIGAAAPAAISAAGRLMGGVNPAASVPTQAALEATRKALYKAADPLPVTLTPEAISAFSDTKGQTAIRRALSAAQWNRDTATATELQSLIPKTGGVVSPGVAITARTADAIHKAFGELSGAMSKSGANYASKGAYDRAVDIDKVLNQVPGMAAARAAYRTEQNASLIQQALQNAQDTAGKNGLASALKSEFSKLLNDKNAHFSDDELAAIRNVAYGGGSLTKGLGALNKLGHSTVGTIGTVLAAEGSQPLFAAPKILGSLAAPLQNKMLTSSANDVLQQARNGGVAVAPRQFTPGTEDFLRRLAISLGPQFALPRPAGQ